MLVKFTIVLLFTLAQTAVLVGSTSTLLGRTAQSIKAGGKGEKETHHLRKMKKGQVDELITLQNGETIDFIPNLRALRRENNSKDWNHGTNEAAAKRRDRMEVCAPSATKDGDTLFLFLR
jgi:hypothetical protein